MEESDRRGCRCLRCSSQFGARPGHGALTTPAGPHSSSPATTPALGGQVKTRGASTTRTMGSRGARRVISVHILLVSVPILAIPN